MKKLLLTGAALLVCFALSSMTWAQQAQPAQGKDKKEVSGDTKKQLPDRSNKGEKVRGQKRAQEVHQMNMEKSSARPHDIEGKGTKGKGPGEQQLKKEQHLKKEVTKQQQQQPPPLKGKE